MKVNDLFDSLNKAIYRVGSDNSPVVIVDVPFVWSEFGVINGDKIKRLDTGDNNQMILLYRCGKGVFRKHYHESDELITVIKGNLKYETYQGRFKAKEKDQINIKKGVHHKFTFEGENNLIMIYYPEFKNKWISK